MQPLGSQRSVMSQRLSTAPEELNWTVRELFASPSVKTSLLRCRPCSMGKSCEKCAVDNQLVFVTHGGFIKHAARYAHMANANKVVFFRANETYATSHVDSSGDECIVLSFSDNALPEHVQEAFGSATPAMASTLALGRAIWLVANLRQARLEPVEAEEAALTILESTLPKTTGHTAGSSHGLIRDIEAALTKDVSDDWSLARLARQFRCSPFHITRLFRSHLGIPLHRYLINLRLAHALGRLVDGEDNLVDLALDLGFSSHSHFSTAFRAALGVSPSRFRQLSSVARSEMRDRLERRSRRQRRAHH